MKRIKVWFFSLQRKNLVAFTLIEIMLSLAIMSVVSLFGVFTYREYNQTKIVGSAASQVEDILLLARSRASTQVKPDIAACSADRVLYGYRVDFCPDNCSSGQNFQLTVVCGDAGQFTQKIGNSYYLPTGVNFGSTSPQSVMFRVLTGEVVGATNLALSGYGRTHSIGISQTGVVSSTSQSGEIPTPTPVPLPDTFYGVSGDLNAGTAEYTFSFNGSSSGYVVDMSTRADMSWDVYLSFGGGSQSPVIVTDPQQRWDKYTCGRILYWRVYNASKTISSPIQTSAVQC